MSGSPIRVIFRIPRGHDREGKPRYQHRDRHMVGIPRKHDGIMFELDGDSVRYSVIHVCWKPARGGCGSRGAPLVPFVTLAGRIAE